mmetsp:Transcript_13616/g.33597  ORF Transcript_13616/g.33597 Transcript_13616/m.33597 type:complete len:97 (+) Transcript_13616:234-524(+)
MEHGHVQVQDVRGAYDGVGVQDEPAAPTAEPPVHVVLRHGAVRGGADRPGGHPGRVHWAVGVADRLRALQQPGDDGPGARRHRVRVQRRPLHADAV